MTLQALQAEQVALEEAYIKSLEENKLSLYDPYDFQVKFHNDKSDRVAILASNQSGKTIAGTVQDAFDLTGLYPDWYEGLKYEKPVRIVCGGINNDKTRDLLQKHLLGNPIDKETSLGTGWIPKHCLDKKKLSLKRGVTDAIGHTMVKHHTNGVFDGWSTLTFSSYESGKEAWMGDTIDIYHGDEECKQEILSQMGRGCIATNGRIRMTFTPENGQTDVLMKIKKEWSLHEATFADVAGEACSYEFDDGEVLELNPVYTMKGKIGHINQKTIENLAKDNMPWMMKTRMLGLPMIGEGRVFAFMDSDIKVEPFSIPEHYLLIDAIDFGGLASTAHPTAFVRAAIDPATDKIYIYDGFSVKGEHITSIAGMINAKQHGQTVPVIWPHDGNKTLGQGAATKIQYIEAGVNMFYNDANPDKSHFTNPPEEGKLEGTGGIQVMPGLTEMSTRFHVGTLKVVSTFMEFWNEFGSYHMLNGKVVDERDDVISACRYIVQSIRHAVSQHKTHRKLETIPRGASWQN